MLTGVEHIALVKGDLEAPGPVLVRVHALNVLEDVLGENSDGHGGRLRAAMAAVHEAGRGVLVLIREPSPTSISDRIKARLGQPLARHAAACATTASAPRSCAISGSPT